MHTATSETESNSLDLSIYVHHYTLRAPCPKGQGTSPIVVQESCTWPCLPRLMELVNEANFTAQCFSDSSGVSSLAW